MINQRESLGGVLPESIPSTVEFPIRKILDLYPDQWGYNAGGEWIHFGRGWIWDMGFGAAKKTEALKRNGFTVGGYDINALAVEQARGRMDFFGKEADIRHFGDGEEAVWDTLSWLERVDALLFQAVFPSLLGDSWKEALDAADMMLSPGRYLFIADFTAADQIYPELFMRRGLLGERIWRESAEKWAQRYKANQEAFADLKLPYRSFAVGAVGPHKAEYDWSNDPSLLRSLYDVRTALPEGFERFASHLELKDLESYLQKMGYTIVEREMVPRRSRGTTAERRWSVAPGFNLIAQKQATYKYDPYRYGLDPDDPRTYMRAKKRKGSPHRGLLNWQIYYGYLLPRVPESQRKIFYDLARSVGVQV